MIANYDYDSLGENALFDCCFPKDIYEIESYNSIFDNMYTGWWYREMPELNQFVLSAYVFDKHVIVNMSIALKTCDMYIVTEKKHNLLGFKTKPMADFDYIKCRLIGEHTYPFIINEYNRDGSIRQSRTFCKPDISICCETDVHFSLKIKYEKEI